MNGGWRLAVVVAAAVLTAGCSTSQGPAPTSTTPADPAVSTLTPLPQPPSSPPSGRLVADMRQSSRDVALGRMQVWIDNDTVEAVTPVAISYADPRLRKPLVGERLRDIPAGSERGFPLYLPSRPACGSSGTGGQVQVRVGETTRTLDVEDSTDVVGRDTGSRCDQLAVSRVATLSWADTVSGGVTDKPVQVGDPATLTLVARPTGRPGRVTVQTVTGTPVLSAVGAAYWTVDRTVRGTDPVTRIALPLKPTRCDPHAFLESGGATTFRVRLLLGRRPVELVLAMSTAGAAAAIDYAQQSCGFTS